jgi:AcrR family transcriptional regulator
MSRTKVIYDKKQIIDIAFRIINEERVDALSARRLAKELNVSTMTMYNYVENIDAVKREVVLQGFNILYGSTYRTLNGLKQSCPTLDVAEYCRVMAKEMYFFASEYPGIYELMLTYLGNTYKKDIEIQPFYRFFSQLYRRVNTKNKQALNRVFRMLEYVMNGMIGEKVSGVYDYTLEEYMVYIEDYIDKMVVGF